MATNCRAKIVKGIAKLAGNRGWGVRWGNFTPEFNVLHGGRPGDTV
jgi:hypothetical protein